MSKDDTETTSDDILNVSVSAGDDLADVSQEAKLAQQEPLPEPSGLGNLLVGSILSWVAVGLFYLTCMFLPLVGQAGKFTSHSGKNFTTFLIVVLLGLLVSLAALVSRLMRGRDRDASLFSQKGSFPWIQAGLTALNLLVLILLFTGSLGI